MKKIGDIFSNILGKINFKIVVMFFLGFCFVFIAFGGYYQVLTSGLFYCGRVDAWPKIDFWFIICLFQMFLYFCSSFNNKFKKIYKFSEYALIPILLILIFQLSFATKSWIVILFFMLIIVQILPEDFFPDKIKKNISNVKNISFLFLIFIWLVVVITSTFSIWILYSRNYLLNNFILFMFIVIAIAISLMILIKSPIRKILIENPLPISLIVLVLLGSKNPDLAYDSSFYKATQPLMLADWRSALTGVFDHTMIGTNFQEIINTFFCILDKNYSPSYISLVSFVTLWIVLTTIIKLLFGNLKLEKIGFLPKIISIAVFCLTEIHIATATSYHEPLMLLFIVLALIPSLVGWVFLFSAIAVKISVIFIAPILIFLYFYKNGTFDINNFFDKKIVFFFLLFLFLFGTQLYRNYEYCGRVLAPDDTLSFVTDTDRVMNDNPKTGYKARGGVINNFFLSALNIWGLNKVVTTAYNNSDDAGFHILPSSRWSLVGILISIVLFIYSFLKKKSDGLILSVLFFICYLFFLKYFTQGRYFVVFSFVSIILLVFLLKFVYQSSFLEEFLLKDKKNVIFYAVILTSIFFLGNDLFVGININNGWITKRDLFGKVNHTDFRCQNSNLEKELKKLVSDYSLKNKNVLSIVADHSVGPLNYLGCHYAFTGFSKMLTLRYFETDQKRADNFSKSVFAIISKDNSFISSIRKYGIMNDFFEYYKNNDITIYVSKNFKNDTIIKHNLGFFEFAKFIDDKSNQLKNKELIKKREIVNLLEIYKESNIINNYNFGSPWGKSVAIIDYDNNLKGLFCGVGSKVFFDIELPKIDNIKLGGLLAYYPVSKTWNVSDGCNIEITIYENGVKVDSSIYDILPSYDVELNLDLYKYSGKKIRLEFATIDKIGYNDAGDWPVIVKPVIYSEEKIKFEY